VALPGRNARAATPAVADGTAEDFIRRLGDRTVAILNEPGAPPEKLEQLKRLLDQATDLELVARLVMGRYWRQASEAQRQEYVRLFKALVMQTMAERFSWYTGETFEVTGHNAVDERDTMVSTRIVRPNGKPPILVDWRVRQDERGYLLIDILAEGVSLVVTQRSEAAEVINQRGIDGLLAEMRARLAKRDTPTGT
jgi:phospholipid transport system substrate-binding protein